MSTYRESTEVQLARAEQLNPSLCIMTRMMPDSARADADRADRAQAAGESLGLLHGMTISVKDNIDTAGVNTTAGAAFLADNVPTADAPVVERLRRAGAVIVGKANMAELAFGSRSFSATGGQCRNPWNVDRIPGGSSGGSAAGVAAEFCTGSLGTDTGGSVRLPACYNGVSGLRPTHGRVPIRGVVPVSEHNDTVGPIARRVSDVARIFAVIAGYDPLDPTTVDHPVGNFLPHLNAGIAGRRIGIPRQHYFDGLEPGVGEAVMAAAKQLEACGATLVDVDVPLASQAHVHHTNMVFSDVCSVFHERLTKQPETITASVVERMSNGLRVTGVQYAEAASFRLVWRRTLAALFADVDILLSPTAPWTAPVIDDGASLLEATKASTRNTYAGALASIPGLSVPCGLTAAGMPIGLQLEAAWWNEPMLLQAGVAYQQRTDFHLLRAPLLR
ncbi:Glutamyl-tRNA(Gln) amidotransferase subunit A [Bordetella tumbae]|uniref:amidase n=1 Tax=Bordetella tumbae TaxID=1649139 RepID=UPI0039F08795